MSRVVIVGSFDSKAVPLGLLIAALKDRGEEPLTIDVSVYPNDVNTTYSADNVASVAGSAHKNISDLGRAKAISVMTDGAADILQTLLATKQVGALVCMGGSNAASVFAGLAPVLPLGIPKILMATAVAGDTKPIIGAEDAVMMYPVVDVDGDNAILRHMIEKLASTAVALKSNQALSHTNRDRQAVALSMYGVTTPCVQSVADLLRAQGKETFVFHANGTGGKSIESFASQGLVDGVVDATMAELGNEVLGGAFPAGSNRFQSAAENGVPQVVAPGAIDMIAFGPRSTVPEKFSQHNIYEHNALVTLVRTTPDECRAIGTRLAERLGRPNAPCTVCIPLGGTSMLDQADKVFFDPDAVLAFRDGLVAAKSANVTVIESPLNINDPAFASVLFQQISQALEECA